MSVVGMLAFSGVAYAYWTTIGAGTGTATTGTLAAPTGVSATTSAGSSNVSVHWTASTGTPTPAGYYVTRSTSGNSSTTAVCGSSPTALVSSTTCTDTGVADGTYAYRVTAVYNSWTSTSSASDFVTVVGDITPPVLQSLLLQDVNGNGKVDRVVATFNEALAASTATNPWSLTNVPSGGSLSAVATSGSSATLTLAEGSGPADTAVGSFRVALAASASGVRDAVGNQSSFAATAPADQAAPVRVSMAMRDVNGNGKVDQVFSTFSENLASSTDATPWALTSVPSSGAKGSVSTSGSTATLLVSEGSGAADTAVGGFTVALSTSASGVRDAAGNRSSFAATAPADQAAPVRVSMAMRDVNVNGKVDQVVATFSENLAPSTATAPWSVSNVPSGGVLASVSSSGRLGTLAFDEGPGAPNTAVGSFTVSLSGTATGVRDAAGNQASFAAVGPADEAAPLLLSFTSTNVANGTAGRAETGDRLVAVFSEAPSGVPTTGMLTADRTGNGSVTLAVANLLSSSSTGSPNYIFGTGTKSFSVPTSIAAADTTVTITLGSSFTGDAPGTSTGGTFSPVWVQAVSDAAGNRVVSKEFLSMQLF